MYLPIGLAFEQNGFTWNKTVCQLEGGHYDILTQEVI